MSVHAFRRAATIQRWTGYALQNGEGSDVAEPIAETLGESVYIVIRDPVSKTVYRCAVPMAALSVSRQTDLAGDRAKAASSSGKVATEQPVTTIALTEDGQYLVAAHEAENQVSIWEVKSGVLTKLIPCQSPRYVLCRGGRVYVANYGQGTITVVDPTRSWTVVGTCPTGAPNVFYLSAPQGRFFSNQILATCGRYKQRSVILVDVASASRSAKIAERSNLGVATVDYRGTTVIEQREFNWETMGYPQAYDYATYVRGGAVPTGAALQRRTGLLAQARPDALWFDDSQVATGLPPTPVLRAADYPFVKAGLVVADQSRPVFYRMEADGIHVRSADSGLAEQGLVPAELPDWACRPSDRYAGQSNPDTRIVPPDVLTNPVAVTLDGRAYLFVVHRGALYRFTGVVPAGGFRTPAAPTSQPAATVAGQPGRLKLAAEPTFMARTRDDSALLVIEGSSLSLLDRDGRAVTRTVALPVLYKKILDRSGYYVALSGAGLDLLDKGTLAVLRHVDIGGVAGSAGTRDLALHPAEPRCYVSVADGEVALAGGASQEVPRVIGVDERTGALRYLRHVYGERLFLDPTGRQLASWIPMHSVSGDPSWELGSLARFLSSAPLWRPAVFAFYQLDSKSARCIAAAENIGPEMTPDQNAIALAGSGLVREYAVDDLQKPAATYRSTAGGRPIVFDYHPRLGIVAVSDDKGVTLYDRSTGQPRPGGRYEVNGVERIVFAPSGRSVCILTHDLSAPQHVLASYPLSLTPAEEHVVSAAAPPEIKRVEVKDDQPEPPSGTIESREIQSLHLPAPAAPMPARQVNQRYLRSVVLVGPGQPRFTGVAVGARGYVVTCAEAINSGANQLWIRSLTPQRQPYATAGAVQVIRIDVERNLALLKVPTDFELPVPLAGASPDAGEPVTLLANGSTDFNGIYGLSVLTGTVSNPSESLNGVRYLQTTVGGGSGALGAPLFDGKGALIGLMARHTRKEGVSFAVPVSDVRDFLNECAGPPAVPHHPTSRPSQNSGRELAEESRNHVTKRATGQAAADIPRPASAKGSPAIAVTETVWEKQVSGGTFFTSADGTHVGWIPIDPRRIGPPDSIQGTLDGVRKPFVNVPFFSDNSRHVLYFLEAAPGAGAGTLRYVLDGESPRSAVAGPANRRPVDFASEGRHVGWVSVKEGRWTESAVIDGIPGKEYQRILCEPSFSPDGAHSAYASITANRSFIIRDGRETAHDGQTGDAIAAEGHVAIVLRESNQCHVEYDGQNQKPYQQIDNLRLSPDGKHVGYVASMLGKRFLVIDGEEKDVSVGGGETLAFGPGGHYACIGGKNNAQLILDGAPQGPSEVQGIGRPSITFSPDGNHVAYLVERQESGSLPFAGGAPLRVTRRYVVRDGALQPLPDDQANATDRLTFSSDGRRLAYVTQSMSQPRFGPDGQLLAGHAAMPRQIQRLIVDGVATDTFTEIRPPVFSADGNHYACLAKRAGHDPIGRDDQWYVVLDGAPAPCRQPISQVPFFDSHNVLRAYTRSPETGPWELSDVYRLDARSQ